MADRALGKRDALVVEPEGQGGVGEAGRAGCGRVEADAAGGLAVGADVVLQELLGRTSWNAGVALQVQLQGVVAGGAVVVEDTASEAVTAARVASPGRLVSHHDAGRTRLLAEVAQQVETIVAGQAPDLAGAGEASTHAGRALLSEQVLVESGRTVGHTDVEYFVEEEGGRGRGQGRALGAQSGGVDALQAVGVAGDAVGGVGLQVKADGAGADAGLVLSVEDEVGGEGGVVAVQTQGAIASPALGPEAAVPPDVGCGSTDLEAVVCVGPQAEGVVACVDGGLQHKGELDRQLACYVELHLVLVEQGRLNGHVVLGYGQGAEVLVHAYTDESLLAGKGRQSESKQGILAPIAYIRAHIGCKGMGGGVGPSGDSAADALEIISSGECQAYTADGFKRGCISHLRQHNSRSLRCGRANIAH